MTTRTLTLRRTRTVEEQVSVTFPIYRGTSDSGYAGSIPYRDWTEMSRLTADGKKLTVRKVETKCDSPDRVVEFSITMEDFDEDEIASDLAPTRLESSATPGEFLALMYEAVTYLGLDGDA